MDGHEIIAAQTAELKKCPFCGGSPELLNGDMAWTIFWVMCPNCGSEGPTKNNQTEAVETWNRRTVNSEQLAVKSEEEK